MIKDRVADDIQRAVLLSFSFEHEANRLPRKQQDQISGRLRAQRSNFQKHGGSADVGQFEIQDDFLRKFFRIVPPLLKLSGMKTCKVNKNKFSSRMNQPSQDQFPDQRGEEQEENNGEQTADDGSAQRAADVDCREQFEFISGIEVTRMDSFSVTSP